MDNTEYARRLDLLMPRSDIGSGLTFGDMFCGIGGFHRGLERHGMKCAYACERDNRARAVYAATYGVGDLLSARRFSDDIIKEIRTGGRGRLDLLCGGFPCQPFSAAGRRLGFSDQRGRLFHRLCKVISEVRPAAFFLENVKNILRIDNGEVWKEILSELRSLQYDVIVRFDNQKFVHETFSSADFGLPQLRERVFIIGFDRHRGGSGDFVLPVPLAPDHPGRIEFGEIVGGRPCSYSSAQGEFEREIARTLTAQGHGHRSADDPDQRWRHPQNRNMYKIYPAAGGEPIYRELTIPERLQLLGFDGNMFDSVPGMPKGQQLSMTGNSVSVPTVYHIGAAICRRLTAMLAEHPHPQPLDIRLPPNIIRQPPRPLGIPPVNPGCDSTGRRKRTKQRKRATILLRKPRIMDAPTAKSPHTNHNTETFSALLEKMGVTKFVEHRDNSTESHAFVCGLDEQIRIVRKFNSNQSLITNNSKKHWFRVIDGALTAVLHHRKKALPGCEYRVHGGLPELEQALLLIRKHALTGALETTLRSAAGIGAGASGTPESLPLDEPTPPLEPQTPTIITVGRVEAPSIKAPKGLSAKQHAKNYDIPWEDSDDYPDDPDNDLWDIAFFKERKPWQSQIKPPEPESILHSYMGNKRSMISLLGEVIPWRDRLVEPFGGGASVSLSFAYRFASRGWDQRFLCADRNPDVISLHQWTADPDLMPTFEAAARRVYADAENQFNVFRASMDDKEAFKQTFKAMLDRQNALSNDKSSWITVGRRQMITAEYASLIMWLQRNAFSKRLRYRTNSGEISIPSGKMEMVFPSGQLNEFTEACNYGRIEFLNSDFRNVMENHIRNGDAVYCDPPYIDEKTKKVSTHYGPPFTLDDHDDLVELAISCAKNGVPVVISNFDNAITRRLYKNATFIYEGITVFDHMARTAKTKVVPKPIRMELIAIFMPPVAIVHKAEPRSNMPFQRRKPYIPNDSDENEEIS